MTTFIEIAPYVEGEFVGLEPVGNEEFTYKDLVPIATYRFKVTSQEIKTRADKFASQDKLMTWYNTNTVVMVGSSNFGVILKKTLSQDNREGYTGLLDADYSGAVGLYYDPQWEDEHYAYYLGVFPTVYPTVVEVESIHPYSQNKTDSFNYTTMGRPDARIRPFRSSIFSAGLDVPCDLFEEAKEAYPSETHTYEDVVLPPGGGRVITVRYRMKPPADTKMIFFEK